MNLTWKKLNEEPYRAGYRRMLKKTFQLPDGSEHVYDVKDDGQAACVLAFTTEGKIIMTRIYRPGPEKILTEMPGGRVEEGENPLEAMKRELLEETGYTGEFEFVGTCIDDAYSNMLRYCYIVKNCTKIAEPKGDDDEFNKTVFMTLPEFRQHLRSGEFTDVEVGYLCLDYLGLL